MPDRDLSNSIAIVFFARELNGISPIFDPHFSLPAWPFSPALFAVRFIPFCRLRPFVRVVRLPGLTSNRHNASGPSSARGR